MYHLKHASILLDSTVEQIVGVEGEGSEGRMSSPSNYTTSDHHSDLLFNHPSIARRVPL